MKNCLQIAFDPNWMLVTLATWREDIERESRDQEESCLTTVENQLERLVNFVQTAIAWKMVLRTMRPSDEHREVFQHLVTAVNEFELWAHKNLTKLKGNKVTS